MTKVPLDSVVHEGVGGVVPQGPTFQWKDGWMFARSDRGIEIWNNQREIEMTIPLPEWDLIINTVSYDLRRGK